MLGTWLGILLSTVLGRKVSILLETAEGLCESLEGFCDLAFVGDLSNRDVGLGDGASEGTFVLGSTSLLLKRFFTRGKLAMFSWNMNPHKKKPKSDNPRHK
jgi:hypothetical protein